MDQVQVVKNKMMRGQVLRTLALFYPSPITISNLKSALITRGMTLTADTTKVLHYLADKKYIKVTKGNLAEIEDDDLIELTASGVDLLEGSVDDLGVDI
jgi:hypothetical protein